MNQIFNTEQDKWDRQCVRDLAKPYGGAIMTINEAGEVANGVAIGARFRDRESAKAVLLAAGYVEVKPWEFKAKQARLPVWDKSKAAALATATGGNIPKIGQKTIIAYPGGGLHVIEKLADNAFLVWKGGIA